MIKRFLLLSATFLVLLLAYGIYRIVIVTSAPQPRTTIATSRPVANIDPASTSKPDPDAGIWLNIQSRDTKTGRLSAVYRAERWRRQKDGSVTLAQPDITLYQADGQEIHILAPMGEILAPERGISFQPDDVKKEGKEFIRRGRLIGGQDGVRIDFVRKPGDDTQTIHARVEDIDINNDLLQIHTDKAVEVHSAEADIFGTGLTIRWNETPNELREMRIETGRKMIIRNVPEQFQQVSLPGSGMGKTPASPNIPMADDDFPIPASRPTTLWAASQVSTTRSSRPARPGATSTGPARVGQNRFEADFTDEAGGIKIDSGDRTVTGAKKMSLIFSWDQPGSGAKKGTPAKSPSPASAPAKRPTTSTGPAAEKEPMVIEWNGPLVLRPVGHADKDERRDYWLTASGDKVKLTDKDTTAYCKSFRFESKGDARPARVTGQFEGTDHEPVRLEMNNLATITCPLMKFDRQDGVADLIGRGEMLTQTADLSTDMGRPKRAASSSAPASGPAPAEAEPNHKATLQKITWTDSVKVFFGEQATTKGAVRQYIREAHFKGGVNMQDLSPDKTGDYVRCDEMTVAMAASRFTESIRVPTEAHAVGNVSACQDSKNIDCDDLTVKFDEEKVATTDGKVHVRAKPSELIAKGTDEKYVIMVDATNPNQLVRAWAKSITSKVDSRSAELFGTAKRPAKVAQGSNFIEGPFIRVDNSPLRPGPDSPRKELMVVLGIGRSEFMSDRDFQGRKLPQEKPMHASWTQRMEYEAFGPEDRDNKDHLIMVGDVKLVSETDNLSAGSLSILFEKNQPDEAILPPQALPIVPGVASKPAKKPRKAIGADMLGRKSIEHLVAKDNVEMSSEKIDTAGVLQQAVTVTGKQLDYHVARKSATEEPDVIVEILGKGYMFMEDYRPPDAQTQPADQSGTTMKLDRPSQTSLAWTDHMKWVQARSENPDLPADAKAPHKSTVTLVGNAQMSQVTGDKVIVKGDLKVPAWPKLAAGRKSRLDCQQMIATFAQPAEDPKKSAGAKPAATQGANLLDGGVRLGELEQFTAVRDVVMDDGPMQVQAQQVEYKKAAPPAKPNQEVLDSLNIFGYVGDEKPTLASLHFEDPKTNQSQHIESPIIRCLLRDDPKSKSKQVVQVKTETARGSGTR